MLHRHSPCPGCSSPSCLAGAASLQHRKERQGVSGERQRQHTREMQCLRAAKCSGQTQRLRNEEAAQRTAEAASSRRKAVSMTGNAVACVSPPAHPIRVGTAIAIAHGTAEEHKRRCFNGSEVIRAILLEDSDLRNTRRCFIAGKACLLMTNGAVSLGSEVIRAILGRSCMLWRCTRGTQSRRQRGSAAFNPLAHHTRTPQPMQRTRTLPHPPPSRTLSHTIRALFFFLKK